MGFDGTNINTVSGIIGHYKADLADTTISQGNVRSVSRWWNTLNGPTGQDLVFLPGNPTFERMWPKLVGIKDNEMHYSNVNFADMDDAAMLLSRHDDLWFNMQMLAPWNVFRNKPGMSVLILAEDRDTLNNGCLFTNTPSLGGFRHMLYKGNQPGNFVAGARRISPLETPKYLGASGFDGPQVIHSQIDTQNKRIKIFKDGLPVAERSDMPSSGNFDPNANEAFIRLGNFTGQAANNFDGLIYSVVICNVPLSDSEANNVAQWMINQQSANLGKVFN